jgi:4'-phosphopantetheinyl transferase
MSQSSTWSEPPSSLSLRPDEVHVWRIELEQPEEVFETLRPTLEPHELERASRFHFEKHRRHFIVGRGFMRRIISHYLSAKPEALTFAYGAYGKPALSGDLASSGLRFNMSHSHEVALFAVATERELGVDVEHIRSDFASEDIARRFFSRREVETFNALPKAQQVAAFFRCWTRKEAYIKAIGRGLSQPLDGFDVTLGPEEPAALLHADDDDVSRWSFSNIEVGEGYAGALAVEGQDLELRCWQISR